MKLYSQEAREIEVERVFYGYIDDLDQLEKMSEKTTTIWQSEIMNGPDEDMGSSGGIIRVRNYDNSRYEMTVKKAMSSKHGKRSLETNMEIDKDMFESFIALSPISYKKTRYVLTNDQGQWDVDALWSADGKSIIPWLKIDLETSVNLTQAPDFPFRLRSWFEVHNKESRRKNTKEQLSLINYLFQNLCLIDNTEGIRTVNVKEPMKPIDINNLTNFM